MEGGFLSYSADTFSMENEIQSYIQNKCFEVKLESADQLLHIFVVLLHSSRGILAASRLIPWEYTFRKLPF